MYNVAKNNDESAISAWLSSKGLPVCDEDDINNAQIDMITAQDLVMTFWP